MGARKSVRLEGVRLWQQERFRAVPSEGGSQALTSGFRCHGRFFQWQIKGFIMSSTQNDRILI